MQFKQKPPATSLARASYVAPCPGIQSVSSKALLSRYFGDEDEMNDNDKFLRDYLLNRRWLDTNQPGPRTEIMVDLVFAC